MTKHLTKLEKRTANSGNHSYIICQNSQGETYYIPTAEYSPKLEKQLNQLPLNEIRKLHYMGH